MQMTRFLGTAVLVTIYTVTTINAAEDPKRGATFGRKVENTFRNWKLEELPPAVQETVKRNAAGRKIADIDREDRTGQTVWEVRFEREKKIHIDNDGRVLDLKGNPLTAAPKPTQPSAEKSPPPPGNTAGPAEKTKRKWADVPAPVKKAAANFGTPNHIRDIDMEVRDGMNVWELEFSREGQNIELHFTEDGRILEHIDSDKSKARKASP